MGSFHFALLCVLCVAALLQLGPISASAHEDLLGRIALLNEQMRTNGTSAELLLLRAEFYRAHQDWASALRDYDAAAKGLTNSEALGFGRAQALAGAGRLVEAHVVLDQVIQHHPTNAMALLARARTLAQLDQPALAIVDYTRAFTNLTTPHPEDYLARAQLHAAQADPAAAVKGLDEGLARLGWMVTLQRAAMDYELASGDFAGALERLETIIARSNRRETWLALKGEILQKAGRPAEARVTFQAALKVIEALPPRLARSEKMVALRSKLESLIGALEVSGP